MYTRKILRILLRKLYYFYFYCFSIYIYIFASETISLKKYIADQIPYSHNDIKIYT